MRKTLPPTSIFLFALVYLIASTFLSPVTIAQITPDASGIVYVKTIASGSGSGTSWANATGDLHGAIEAAGASQVWVATGTYNVSPTSSFIMKNDLAIYGGFDPAAGIDDLTDTRIFPNTDHSRGSILNGKNERPVMWNYGSEANPINSSAVLDGFTLTGGAGSQGAGIFNLYASPTLSNLLIAENSATNGGAIYNQASSPVLTNVAVVKNTATGSGGGVYNHSGSPVFTNVTFTNNTTNAIYVAAGTPQFNNSIVYGGISGTFLAQYSLIEGSTSTANNNLNATGILPAHIFLSAANGNYGLVSNSPVTDRGNNSLFPGLGGSTPDLAGHPRLSGTKIDLGAYEFFGATPNASGVVYVKATGTGAGKSWADATGNLQAAIDATGAQQVWVEKGTYEVSASSFIMKNNVAIYGGFDPDNGVDDLTDARILPNVHNLQGTVLDGREERPVIWNVFTSGNRMDNTAILNGFTLTKGANSDGGGIHNQYASPTLMNLVIKGNSGSAGGGIWNDYSSPLVQNCTFKSNTASCCGGGVYNNNANPKLINCLFYGNTGQTFGGGGMYNNLNSSPVLINCTLTANHANNSGGAMYSLSYSHPVFENCIVYGNTAAGGEPGINFDGTFTGTWPRMYNSLIQERTQFDTETAVTFASGNVFFNSAITDLFNNPSAEDYTLKPGGPAIDRGYNSFPQEANVTTDLAGNPRIRGNRVDLGVYEAEACAVTSTLFVNGAIVSTGNGGSWPTAYKTLKEAVAMAELCPNVTEIRVAAGNYYPTGMQAASDRTASFIITRSNLKILGGYNATTGDRNVGVNATVLSGEVGTSSASDNSFHVMLLAGVPASDSLIIDGFTLSNGLADGGDFPEVNGQYTYQDSGAGLFITNVGANVVIRNCTFTNNHSALAGGGIYKELSYASIRNCIFKNNSSVDGGGIYNTGSSFGIYNSTFSENSATSGNGGGLANDGSELILSKCTFTSNSADLKGGAIFSSYSHSDLSYCIIKSNSAADAGGIYVTNSPLEMRNVSITSNTAVNKGGGIHSLYGTQVLTNVSVVKNTAGTASTAAIYFEGNTPEFNNSIIYGGISGGIYTAKYSLIEGGTSSANGNVDATGITDLMIFADPSSGDYSLLKTSPALNAGSNSLFTGLDANTKDLAGNLRLFGPAIDMGAYELMYIIPDANGIVYVRTVATGNGSGKSWTDATADFQGAIDAVGTHQVWVASGNYDVVNNGFVMKNNVAIYGGFDPENGIDDKSDNRIMPNSENSQGSILNGKNQRTVVRNIFTSANLLNNTALLDGFSVINGNGSSNEGARAGGIANEYASPTLINLVIKNGKGSSGGGILNDHASPVVTNVTIKNNTALFGGGLYNVNNSNPVLKDVIITGNTASTTNGGGVCNLSSGSVFINVVIADNTAAGEGGGFYNNGGNTSFANVTVVNNTAGTAASGAIHNEIGTHQVNNSIIYGGVSSGVYGVYAAQHSLTEGNTNTANGNISASGISAVRIFTSPSDKNYTLLPCSPAVNAGDDLLIPSGVSTDISGAARIQLGNVDLGAHEAASNNPDAGANLVTEYLSITRTLDTTAATLFTNDCATLIAKISRVGPNPITGEATARAWIESVQPGNFVKRHYEIFPASGNPELLSGEITLFFTQNDFDDYNLINSVKLPTGPGDSQGLDHLIIEKRGGRSSDGTGLPGSFPGIIENLGPDKLHISWNAVMLRWEVRFSVIGFSGFFVKTNSGPLPVRWMSFTAHLNEQRKAELKWKVDESNVSHYQVEKSGNAKDFRPIAKVAGKGDGITEYAITDEQSVSGQVYYRIRQIDVDGTYTYSRMVPLFAESIYPLRAYPNPLRDQLTVEIGSEYVGSAVKLINSAGSIVEQLIVREAVFKIDFGKYPAGIYILQTFDGKTKKVIKY